VNRHLNDGRAGFAALRESSRKSRRCLDGGGGQRARSRCWDLPRITGHAKKTRWNRISASKGTSSNLHRDRKHKSTPFLERGQPSSSGKFPAVAVSPRREQRRLQFGRREIPQMDKSCPSKKKKTASGKPDRQTRSRTASKKNEGAFMSDSFRRLLSQPRRFRMLRGEAFFQHGKIAIWLPRFINLHPPRGPPFVRHSRGVTRRENGDSRRLWPAWLTELILGPHLRRHISECGQCLYIIRQSASGILVRSPRILGLYAVCQPLFRSCPSMCCA